MRFVSCSYQGTSFCDDSCGSYETCPLIHYYDENPAASIVDAKKQQSGDKTSEN